MAIVVEEERSYQVNWLSIITWIVIGGIVVSALYYVFFKNPTIVEQALPMDIRETQEVAKMRLDPERVFSHEVYRSLSKERFIPQVVSSTTTTRRGNPFLPM